MKGLGSDIIEISRIRTACQRHGNNFLNKIFTKEERDYCEKYQDPFVHYAGRFAAKEAVIKALGKGFRDGISWLDIEIRNDQYGKPLVLLSQTLTDIVENATPKIMVTISHCKEYAMATAIWIKTD